MNKEDKEDLIFAGTTITIFGVLILTMLVMQQHKIEANEKCLDKHIITGFSYEDAANMCVGEYYEH